MRRWGVVAFVLLVVAGVWLGAPAADLPVETEVVPRAPVILPEVAPDAPIEAREPEAEAERPVQAYDRVVQACGFDVEERCVPSGCGAVVAMPDLDRIDGWLRLAFEQPGVVGSTAARDLGLPVAWTGCGDALMASPEVMAAQVDWDRELWCVGDREACDVAAAERYGWTGFTGGVRLTRRVFVLD